MNFFKLHFAGAEEVDSVAEEEFEGPACVPLLVLPVDVSSRGRKGASRGFEEASSRRLAIPSFFFRVDDRKRTVLNELLLLTCWSAMVILCERLTSGHTKRENGAKVKGTMTVESRVRFKGLLC